MANDTKLVWKRGKSKNYHYVGNMGEMGYPETHVFARGKLKILVGQEPVYGPGTMTWHLSISHPKRLPTWDELKMARYELLPDEVTMAMLLPPKAQYVDVHPNCLHLYEFLAAPELLKA